MEVERAEPGKPLYDTNPFHWHLLSAMRMQQCARPGYRLSSQGEHDRTAQAALSRLKRRAWCACKLCPPARCSLLASGTLTIPGGAASHGADSTLCNFGISCSWPDVHLAHEMASPKLLHHSVVGGSPYNTIALAINSAMSLTCMTCRLLVSSSHAL